MKRFLVIANRIRELRGEKSQSDFAAEVGIPLRTYQNYESGERMPKGQALQKIAQACNVPVEYILTGDETGLRQQLSKDLDQLHADVQAEIERMPRLLGGIDPVLERIFSHWAAISEDDKKDVLQFVFYKKKIEHLFNKLKGLKED